MSDFKYPHDLTADPELENPNSVLKLPHVIEDEERLAPTPQDQALTEESKFEKLMTGAGLNLKEKGMGIRQLSGLLGNSLLPGEPSSTPQDVGKELKDLAPYRKSVYKDPWAKAGYLGADLATAILGPNRLKFWTGGTPSVGGGALTGGALSSLTPEEEPDIREVPVKFGKGALWGGGGVGTLNFLANQAGRAKNMALGKFEDPDVANRYRIFRESRVPASLGDLTQNPIIQGLENVSQSVPLTGRHGFLEHQSNKLNQFLEQAPTDITGGVPSATREAIGEALVDSIKRKYRILRGEAKTKYDDVSNLVRSVGNPPITPTETALKVNSLLSKYPTVFAKLSDDPRTVKTLQEIAQGVGPQASVILGANGKPLMKPPQLTFDELRELDKGLGSLIRQGRSLTARGELNNQSFDQLVSVQKALRKDVSDWSVQVGNPDIARGVSEANKFFRDQVMPFRQNRLIRKVIQDGEYNPDDVAKSLFSANQPYKTDQAIQFLTPDGIQTGRFYLVNEAKNRAANAGVHGFSPDRLIRELNLGETGPKLYSSGELARIEDLQELAHSARRAANFSADPANASRWALLSPLFSLKVPLAARLFSTMGTSDRSLRYLLSDPRLYTGSGEGLMGGLGQASENVLRRSGGGMGGGFKDIQPQDQ